MLMMTNLARVAIASRAPPAPFTQELQFILAESFQEQGLSKQCVCSHRMATLPDHQYFPGQGGFERLMSSLRSCDYAGSRWQRT